MERVYGTKLPFPWGWGWGKGGMNVLEQGPEMLVIFPVAWETWGLSSNSGVSGSQGHAVSNTTYLLLFFLDSSLDHVLGGWP